VSKSSSNGGRNEVHPGQRWIKLMRALSEPLVRCQKRGRNKQLTEAQEQAIALARRTLGDFEARVQLRIQNAATLEAKRIAFRKMISDRRRAYVASN
jgi:hypothetical protein